MPVPDSLDSADPIERAAAAAALALGHVLDRDATRRLRRLLVADPDRRVRAAAANALVRVASRTAAREAWRSAATDHDPDVRRRAAELAPGRPEAALRGTLVALLDDPEPSVAEAAAFALGELADPTPRVVRSLSRVATAHGDPLVRESAVAALGALGDPAGLRAVLHACDDRPAIRRRAVLALAAFEGPEVEAALRRALGDADWQVRQAADDLLR